jgi:hypothetical protein
MTFDQKGNLVPQSENNFPLSSQDTNAERQQAKKQNLLYCQFLIDIMQLELL